MSINIQKQTAIFVKSSLLLEIYIFVNRNFETGLIPLRIIL